MYLAFWIGLLRYTSRFLDGDYAPRVVERRT